MWLLAKCLVRLLTGLTLQALSRAMDLAPHHHQLLQEVQEAKTHLTLQQLAEVEQTTCHSPALSNGYHGHCIVIVRMIADSLHGVQWTAPVYMSLALWYGVPSSVVWCP